MISCRQPARLTSAERSDSVATCLHSHRKQEVSYYWSICVRNVCVLLTVYSVSFGLSCLLIPWPTLHARHASWLTQSTTGQTFGAKYAMPACNRLRCLLHCPMN